jgi:hypothetical protein
VTLDLRQIYALLPALYRIRDAEIAVQSGAGLDAAEQQELAGLLAGIAQLSAEEALRLAELQDRAQQGPLKSLFAVIAEQVEVLEESLLQSYDDLFIETCQEWVVPYIGQLLAVQNLQDFPGSPFSLRAAIADTISDRRRKGTVSVLERIARDVTGWDANVVEYFQLLATTQFMNHIRPGNTSMADVRQASWRLLGTPFDSYTRRADVRSIEKRLGAYNIPNVGIFVWRIPQQRLERSPALRVDGRRFFFDAIGRNTQLFTFPQTEDSVTARATPFNVPMPITRRIMLANLGTYVGTGSSLSIEYGPSLSPPPGAMVTVCDLSDVHDSGGHVVGWAHQPANSIGIDPELGRIAFPATLPPPSDVHVNYCYGFSSEIGGGSYSRPGASTQPDVPISVPAHAPTIQAALDAAALRLTGQKSFAVIEITNNEYFVETPRVNIPAGKKIEVRAKDGNRPVLVLSGDMAIVGGNEAIFRIDGLLVAGGSLIVPLKAASGAANLLTRLEISHCTLAPCDTPAILTAPAQLVVPRLHVEAVDAAVAIDHSILGAIRIIPEATCSMTSCIVDANGELNVAYAAPDSAGAGAPLTVSNSTMIGKVHARQVVLASNTLFVANVASIDSWAGPVLADQLQQGCVRFSYVPAGSHVPRRYRCHPADSDPVPVFPAFTSLHFGDPGYCQLAQASGPQILQGADDGSEMGVFHDLFQPQRVANLQTSLKDYLRFGLNAGVLYAS